MHDGLPLVGGWREGGRASGPFEVPWTSAQAAVFWLQWLLARTTARPVCCGVRAAAMPCLPYPPHSRRQVEDRPVMKERVTRTREHHPVEKEFVVRPPPTWSAPASVLPALLPPKGSSGCACRGLVTADRCRPQLLHVQPPPPHPSLSPPLPRTQTGGDSCHRRARDGRAGAGAHGCSRARRGGGTAQGCLRVNALNGKGNGCTSSAPPRARRDRGQGIRRAAQAAHATALRCGGDRTAAVACISLDR